MKKLLTSVFVIFASYLFPLAGQDDENRHVFLGVSVTEVAPEVRAHTTLDDQVGLLVNVVYPDTPAAKAGLKNWDILVSFDDISLMSHKQLKKLLMQKKLGESATLKVLRKTKLKVVDVLLDQYHRFDRKFLTLHLKDDQAPDPARQMREYISKIIQADERTLLVDHEHKISIEKRNGERWLIVKSAQDDTIVWEGSIESEQNREKIPNNINEKVEGFLQFLDKRDHDISLSIKGLMDRMKDGARLKFFITDPDEIKKLKEKIEREKKDIEKEIEEVQKELEEMQLELDRTQDELEKSKKNKERLKEIEK